MRFDDTPTAFFPACAPRLEAPHPAGFGTRGRGRFLLRKAGFAALMAVLSACTSDGLELEPSARLDPDRAAPVRASSGLAPVAEPPPGPAAAPLAEPDPEGAIGPAASSSGYPARHHRALAAAPSASFPSASASSAGVDVDGMLGEPAVKGLAEEEAEQIAEGRSSQPVVDGIGGEVHAVAPRRLPEPESGPPPAIDPDLPPLPPRAGAARRSDARPLTRAGEDQVAFIPLMVPKSDAPM